MHSNERGDYVYVPYRPKAEAFINAVDVVVHLHDPSRSSIERRAPSCSAHVPHDDVPRALDPVEAEGEFCQHDGVVMVLVKNNLRRASPKRYENYDGG